MTRVLLADEHLMVRQALAKSLNDAGHEVVSQVGSGDDAVSQVHDLAPDVAVLDIHLTGMSGIDACRRIADAGSTKVLVLTNERETSMLSSAFRSGATGYLLKTASMDALLRSIQQVRRGETVVSNELKPALLAEARGLTKSNGTNGSTNGSSHINSGSPAAASTATLARPISKREGEVLQLIADGSSTIEVAEQLFISQKTVKNHLASIYSKLDARDRTQAVLTAVRLGLIDLR